MCDFLTGGNMEAPDAPNRYEQQKQPNGRDTADAKMRAEEKRRRATSTILADNVGAKQTTGSKLLLSGAS